MIIYYTLYFSCSFYISRAYLKSFLQDVRHNLWGFDQDEVAVANYGSQIQEKYTVKQGMRIAKMIFLIHSKTFLKRAFCKMYATICGWASQDEGAVACYNTQLQVKYTAKWGVQIAKWF